MFAHLTKLRLTVNTAGLPPGWNIPLVLYLCNPTLYEWEGTVREAHARLALLPAIWISKVVNPNVLSKDGRVWIRIIDREKEK